jgi:DNA processing protein
VPPRDLPTEPDPRYWVAFSHAPGIGPVRLSALVTRFGTLEAAWNAPAPALADVLDQRSCRALLGMRRQLDLDRALQALDRLGASVVHWGSADYPPLLRESPHAPYALYVLGDVALLDRPAAAVVGTRRPTPYGRQAAADIANGIAAAGVTVVSGLAVGIDTVAHRAALDVQGPTLAVLGCGLDVPYPAANRGLQAEVAQTGAIVSEYPLGTVPDPGNFPARNRIVAALSLATVVIEAGETSGALITARLAADLGRDVLAVPGSIYSRCSVGTHRLLADGAGLARGAADVLDALGLDAMATPPLPASIAGDPTSSDLLAALADGPQHIDDLARRAQASSAEVARALGVMEVTGLVRHLGQMVWSAAPGVAALAAPRERR